jgi:hypothetical protein
MENRQRTSEPLAIPAQPQREIRLEHAAIEAGGAELRRTARFTDGSTGAVQMQWSDVRRVAAFRRDVMTQAVLCVAVTDSSQVVVLDEGMEGWDGLLKELSKHLSESASFTQWRESIQTESQDSYWTALFEGQ